MDFKTAELFRSIIGELAKIGEEENYFVGKKMEKSTGNLYGYVGVKLTAPLEDAPEPEEDSEEEGSGEIGFSYEPSSLTNETEEVDVDQIERVMFNEEPVEKTMSIGEKMKYLKNAGWAVQSENKISNKFKAIIFFKKCDI